MDTKSFLKVDIEQIPPKPMYVLIVEPEDIAGDAPVLLFLHGKGEAGVSENEVPKVLLHLSPPFQAIQGHLRNVTVVAPLAPHNPGPKGENPEPHWNWREHVDVLHEYMKRRFSQRMLLATGFSRGGLGILQLLEKDSGLFAKWALVDPQRASDADEEKRRLVDVLDVNAQGWLIYGENEDDKTGKPKDDWRHENKLFSDLLAARLGPEHTLYFGFRLSHPEMARRAHIGEEFNGLENMYEFLGLT
ncbi:MAG: alpha/beta hydrolase [Phycisphaerae bacterium]|nr:alpha/beta hydrolase [Phycisphaerae bacterium]